MLYQALAVLLNSFIGFTISNIVQNHNIFYYFYYANMMLVALLSYWVNFETQIELSRSFICLLALCFKSILSLLFKTKRGSQFGKQSIHFKKLRRDTTDCFGICVFFRFYVFLFVLQFIMCLPVIQINSSISMPQEQESKHFSKISHILGVVLAFLGILIQLYGLIKNLGEKETILQSDEKKEEQEDNFDQKYKEEEIQKQTRNQKIYLGDVLFNWGISFICGQYWSFINPVLMTLQLGQNKEQTKSKRI